MGHCKPGCHVQVILVLLLSKGIEWKRSSRRCLQPFAFLQPFRMSGKPSLQANKEHGASGRKVLNDDSIVHCGMNVQKRVHDAHLQVSLHMCSDECVIGLLLERSLLEETMLLTLQKRTKEYVL